MIIARIDKMQSVWTVRLHPTSERICCFSITVTVGAIKVGTVNPAEMTV